MRNLHLFAVLSILLTAVFVLLVSSPAQLVHAQFLPGDSNAEERKGLDLLLDEAREDGSTVIVIKPGENTGAEAGHQDSRMREELIMKARTRVEEILVSATTLWPNMIETLRLVSPNGGNLWLLRSFLTAFSAFLVGWFAITRIQKVGVQYFAYMWNPNPDTTADKAKYLLFRVVLALVYSGVFFLIAIAVVIIIDPALPVTRRLIFEVALAYVIYRFLRRGISWNLFAYDAPSHRLVNLNDDDAVRMDRDWGIAVAAVLPFTAAAGFFGSVAEQQGYAGLTSENVRFLQIFSAAVVTMVVVIFTLKHRKPLQSIFAPRDPESWMSGVRTVAARFVPGLLLLYLAIAFLMFMFQLALERPAPSLVVAAPFVILFVSAIAQGVALLIIQWFYNRRIRHFQKLAEAQGAKHEREAAQLEEEAGEMMMVDETASRFEYQPAFRSFFENASLVIIGTLALREVGRVWGADVGAEGNPWSAFLNILLAAVLCWLFYRAMSIFIDKRIAEEVDVPDDGEEERDGEGGGAGESRIATLLPIMRYMMIIVVFSVACMVILSSMGFDIGPIFAGAGVVGIAVGFGAQTLIRDIFSGAFFLMDDAFRKGEYVSIGDTKGVVEKISIRSFQLRHHLGPLNTIPFGEVKLLTNYSRDWVMEKLPFRVTYDTDVEKVRKLIKTLGQDLLEHPEVGHKFLQPLKSQGVYKMEDSAMILRVKFMTKPGEQFVVRKMVYQAIQEKFTEAGIRFAHKEVTVRLADGAKVDDLSEEQKRTAASAARSVIDAEGEPVSSGDR